MKREEYNNICFIVHVNKSSIKTGWECRKNHPIQYVVLIHLHLVISCSTADVGAPEKRDNGFTCSRRAKHQAACMWPLKNRAHAVARGVDDGCCFGGCSRLGGTHVRFWNRTFRPAKKKKCWHNVVFRNTRRLGTSNKSRQTAVGNRNKSNPL